MITYEIAGLSEQKMAYLSLCRMGPPHVTRLPSSPQICNYQPHIVSLRVKNVQHCTAQLCCVIQNMYM